MTDNEIIKYMQCVIGNEVNCSECTYQKVLPFPSCRNMCAKNALDLINRQKAEIERLKADKIIAERHEKDARELYKDVVIQLKTAKSEAIKEFAERLKEEIRCEDDCGYHCYDCCYECKDYVTAVENLVKEMTEENEK